MMRQNRRQIIKAIFLLHLFKENEEVGEKTRNSIFGGKTFYVKVTSPSIYGNRIKIEHYETVVENMDKNGKYRGEKIIGQ